MTGDSASTTSVRARPDVILFSVQVGVIVFVIVASVINLTWYKENLNLWTMILTSCLGYLMPNPKFKIVKEEDHTLIQNNASALAATLLPGGGLLQNNGNEGIPLRNHDFERNT